MEHIREELTFIDILFAFVGCPSHFSFTLHLAVHEFSNIVSAIRPFKFTVSLDLRITQIAPINERFLRADWFERKMRLPIVPNFFPFFVTFTVDEISAIEETTNLDSAII